MPTANRRRHIPLALDSYLSQDWEHKELIVLEDGDESTADLFAAVPHCIYVEHRYQHQRIGTKRNECCELAHGEIIVHFDSDDWSAPNRISDQVSRLLDSGKAVSGYHSLLFWDDEEREASKYTNVDSYSLGTALCYRKDWWNDHRFPATSYGEDNTFAFGAGCAKQLISVDGEQKLIARLHSGNTQQRHPHPFPIVPTETIPQKFFAALKRAGL